MKRSIVMAAVTSVLLLGTAGTAFAQEDPSTPPASDTSTSAPAPTESSTPPSEPSAPAEQPGAPGAPEVPPAANQPEEPSDPEEQDPAPPPDPLVSAIATCHNGTSEVTVYVLFEEPDAEFLVQVNQIVNGIGFSASKSTTFDSDSALHTVTFNSPPVGLYNVHVTGIGIATDIGVEVKDCRDLKPSDGALRVDVECKAGWGIVTFQVANQETGDVASYTLTSDAALLEYAIELSPGLFLRISENGLPDGEYNATLTDENGNVVATKDFTVVCESGNAPTVVQAAGDCDVNDPSKPSTGFVVLRNENRTDVTYTVIVRQAGKPELSKQVTVAPGQTGSAEFESVGAGDHPVQIKGSDDTVAATVLVIDDCTDVKPDADGLQVSVKCADGKSVVTFRFFPTLPFPRTNQFSVDGSAKFNETVFFGGEGPYQFSRFVGEFADGTHTARLVGNGLNTVEQFTVDCVTEAANPAPQPQGRSDSGLADTGANIGGTLLIGLLTLAAGTVLVLTTRRRLATKTEA